MIDVLRQLDAESVDCCVTSPPYWGLRDYGVEPQKWGLAEDCDHEYEVVERKGQEGGHGEQSPIQQNRVEPMFEKREVSHCVKCEGWLVPLGLEPTPDLFVKHLTQVFHEVRRVLKPSGTLWVNMGDTYSSQPAGNTTPSGFQQNAHREGTLVRMSFPTCPARKNRDSQTRSAASGHRGDTGVKEKDLVGVPWMLAFSLRGDGWWLRRDIIWSKPNPMPESPTDRCTTAHEYIFHMTKSKHYFYDADKIREPHTTPVIAGWQPERGVYGEGVKGTRGPAGWHELGRNKRSVWEIPVRAFAEAHFATYPPKLVATCIQAGCPEGGTVLDPFSGSGTTCKVARQHGMKSIGIELNPEYCQMQKNQMSQLSLWSGASVEGE